MQRARIILFDGHVFRHEEYSIAHAPAHVTYREVKESVSMPCVEQTFLFFKLIDVVKLINLQRLALKDIFRPLRLNIFSRIGSRR